MRITRCDGEFLVSLNAQEASRLMDACAMVVLAADSVPTATLPSAMATVLGDLFEGLRGTGTCPATPDPLAVDPMAVDHPDA
ncbi:MULTISPECIES: hypothetical protein [Aphanothece]|uniref:hypothetical protein n=1 Tax=Aphanothece TaxID=1121 RepID=UPI00398465ED